MQSILSRFSFDSWGPATILIVVVTVLAVLAGAVVVIVNPDTLSFQTYLEDLQRFLGAVAGLGLARAVHLGAQHIAQRNDPSFTADLTDRKGAHDVGDEEFPNA